MMMHSKRLNMFLPLIFPTGKRVIASHFGHDYQIIRCSVVVKDRRSATDRLVHV